MVPENLETLVERVYSAQASRADIEEKLDELAAHLGITSLQLDASVYGV